MAAADDAQVAEASPRTARGASRARVILCLSADPGDGKSTVVAALAIAKGKPVSGWQWSRPISQARPKPAAGSGRAQGLADVLAGRLTVEEAMQHVSLVRAEAGVGTGLRKARRGWDGHGRSRPRDRCRCSWERRGWPTPALLGRAGDERAHAVAPEASTTC